VYITNIVKDRPQNNRDPLPSEIAVYGPFLDRQIEIIKPKVIATLGRYSMEYIMKKFGLDGQLQTISLIHGKSFNAKRKDEDIKIIHYPGQIDKKRGTSGKATLPRAIKVSLGFSKVL